MLLSTGEAAVHIGVHVRSLQQWAHDGIVTPEYVTPGGRMRWNIDHLLEQLKSRSKPAVPARTSPPGQGRPTTGATA